ncbi:hypothetical protein ACFQ1S_15040, partial [Kibdelosporangium lantanae]
MTSTLAACVIPATVTNEPQTDALQIVFADLEAIALPRRAEILQHLNMIFDAATQDKVDQLNAETVAAERTGNNRSDRAWKFFHPEPEAPRRAAPTPHDGGQPKSRAWVATVFGGGGFVALSVLGFEGELLLPTGVFLLGCVLAGWSESDVLCVRIRRAMKVFEANRFDDTLDDDEDTDLKSNATMKFATAVRRQMDYYFTHWRPTAGKKVMDNDQWRTRTARLRSTLHARLVRLYGTSRVPVSKLNWLIRWYAKQAARQWQKNSELPDTRETLQLRVNLGDQRVDRTDAQPIGAELRIRVVVHWSPLVWVAA